LVHQDDRADETPVVTADGMGGDLLAVHGEVEETTAILRPLTDTGVHESVRLKPRLYQELVHSTTQRRVWLIGMTSPLGWICHSQPSSASSSRVVLES
jgi:hypothetical protein